MRTDNGTKEIKHTEEINIQIKLALEIKIYYVLYNGDISIYWCQGDIL